MGTVFLSVLLGVKQPEAKPCVIDQCENDTCVIETPEGFVEVPKKEFYEEGLRLTIDECPIELIEPTQSV